MLDGVTFRRRHESKFVREHGAYEEVMSRYSMGGVTRAHEGKGWVSATKLVREALSRGNSTHPHWTKALLRQFEQTSYFDDEAVGELQSDLGKHSSEGKLIG